MIAEHHNKGLDNIALDVNDIQTAKDFYGKAFG